MSCVWLDWIDHWNFILDYRLVHTWSAHTTHKSNVQWMLIPFLWLYVFKCDVYTQLLVNQIKKIFESFICFWKCFYAFVCLEFLVQNVYFRFLLKKKKLFQRPSTPNFKFQNEDCKFQNTLNFRQRISWLFRE